jgi:integrase/recombinase XerD
MTIITLTEFTRDIRDFLEFKRAMGYTYRRGEFTLDSLKRFARSRFFRGALKTRSHIHLEDIVNAWLARPGVRKANSIASELGPIRQLCLYRRRRDPHAFVPDPGSAPKRKLPFTPYVFSHKEVNQLLRAAERYRHANVGPELMRTLLLILYCTGLRFGEAVRLQLPDVDLSQRMFLIRDSKGRTRYVPFGKDLGHELVDWFSKRRRIVSSRSVAGTDAIFLRADGKVLDIKRAWEAVTRLVRLEGLKPSRGRSGPRPYDWRHTHAVHRLSEWYRKGVDVQARLPWLSAYMGHLNVLGTSVYLHATPELLRLASQRLKRRLNLVEHRL